MERESHCPLIDALYRSTGTQLRTASLETSSAPGAGAEPADMRVVRNHCGGCGSDQLSTNAGYRTVAAVRARKALSSSSSPTVHASPSIGAARR